ncbi:hypothetical protein ETD86_12840 [Nonomuraea turkmeniaca]|uniref:Uncharacterized protein n=1 Tax=Nonomuraea turkmeniaca TaxID=103838 RepID=A0A5S4FMZ4_9ACTN|nr:hypothetical protein [Nonomuraea turkmeniaca]TMR22053.1 hypothetical protein ETD86_12840 [Nonomuraea turkmeniaca]
MTNTDQARALSRLMFQWREAHPDGPDDPNDDPAFLQATRELQGLDPDTGRRAGPQNGPALT